MAALNPAKFIREVRQEIDKITWPTRKETMVSTLMVLGLVMVASLGFVIIDWVVGSLIHYIIGIV